MSGTTQVKAHWNTYERMERFPFEISKRMFGIASVSFSSFFSWLNLPVTTILASLTIWILLAINGQILVDITACDW